MNELSPSDPRLAALEARLAATPPQLSPAEEQQLLYQCAFAAGQGAAGKMLWRWRAIAATLLLLTLGMSMSIVQGGFNLARTPLERSVPVDTEPPRMMAKQQDIPEFVRPRAAVRLDAWRVQESMSGAAVVAQFDHTDPNLHSLTVGALTRQVLQP